MNSELDPPPLALYVHIPWCERKCPYCDFNSHEGFKPDLEPVYVAALLADIEAQEQWIDSRPIASIFIGGGTPSLFSADAIGKLLDGVARVAHLPAGTEITLETNPGSAEASRYIGYRAAGVNRLSIGVQSFDDKQLTRLGRIHTASNARLATELARSAGFDRFNIDLMHGLPNQSVESALDDLNQALACGGDHLSWYQLTIERNTEFFKRPPILPQEKALGDIQERGEALLLGQGFEQYEVSAFARPGQQCHHNLNYWQFGDYLGVGAGAHGKITDSTGILRTQRTRLPRDYLQSIKDQAPPKQTRVAASDLAGEFMMNALRLRQGFSTDLLLQRTGLGTGSVNETLRSLESKGLIAIGDSNISATALGWRFLDDVVGEFFDA
ncbi:putative oxygen-independent coproporphyrinogen III oxidase [Luminiphilus syltensis NOR5-1B]|uniref:Heme chaperone HemW n=1 Tax=Luminiphilus syltensis NOR5-1B TaxID=565045 RepID=B8KU83_9GAMM|nr:radical SAM family heme chaperone HemW [Luminiphilus syltensis]EED34403.1 putative oxygen-independent coproporphyrinogen III oxidase [Luminiphilus syltensis NOR5-1B]